MSRIVALRRDVDKATLRHDLVISMRGEWYSFTTRIEVGDA